MSSATDFSCRCRKVTGSLNHIDPREGTHVVCHCGKCRLANEYAGIEGTSETGVDLFQTTPDRLTIATGMEQLSPKEFSSKGGIYRWHAMCCNTPMFNTMKSPGLPFVGVLVQNLADPAPLGPVVAHGFVDKGNGKQGHQNGAMIGYRLIKRALKAKFSGASRNNPFFTPDGQPVAAAVRFRPADNG